MIGSPPRAWGGRWRGRRWIGRGRLTPTCVGRTTRSTAPASPRAAHPHVRGEDVTGSLAAQAPAGSPPRAWGGRARRADQRRRRRLTPTCVGRTTIPGQVAWVLPAHPHVRGEDTRSPTNRPGCGGSPPRAWGGRFVGHPVGRTIRLTPTCVGRTSRLRTRRWYFPAHPHVRGEDSSTTRRLSWCCGSPPRAWGGLQRRLGVELRKRLTPTCVGRTAAATPSPRRPTAHPHVRGEDEGAAAYVVVDLGSPPRAWGGRRGLWLGGPLRRLTPTCVGRTSPRNAAGGQCAAHPHVRGEDPISGSAGSAGWGSPPRAWGGQREAELASLADRLTPTCVGRTSGRRRGRCATAAHPHVRGED